MVLPCCGTDAGPLEKPEIIKTHIRDLVITPELIGSIVAIYNGKVRDTAPAVCWDGGGLRGCAGVGVIVCHPMVVCRVHGS